MDKQVIHYCEEYLLNPIHPISVDLVGCGGSGSMMLSCLARINSALKTLGSPGLQVRAFDDDDVEETNIGRQLFTAQDLGCNKAVALISRFNRCYGTIWKAVPERYKPDNETNIIITCTDNVASRKAVSRLWNSKVKKPANAYGDDREHRNYYWLDLGNTQKTGQVILGSKDIHQPASKLYHTQGRLKTVDDLFHLKKSDEKLSGPSCSLAEALSKQDLFINSVLAQYAGALLWQLLKEGVTDNQGVFINLESMLTKPLKIAE